MATTSMDAKVTGKKAEAAREKNAQKAIAEKLKKANPGMSDADIKKEVNKIIKRFTDAGKKNLLLEQKSEKELRKERIQAQKDLNQMQMDSAVGFTEKLKVAGDSMKTSLEEAGEKLKENLGNVLSNLGNMFDIKGQAELLGRYSSKIDARLQGYEGQNYGHFAEISELIRDNLAASPYITQSEMLENLNTLVDQGIAFNLEQRAFLETVSDKIVTTFDTFSGSLMRIIRLQGADSTAARVGMEAYLTQMLNKYYQDSAYLSTNFDSVQDAIFNLSSSLDKETSVEMEYTIQKWLGSLSSVGVSDNTIQQLAASINALGTGDVETLQSSNMQNLLVMASNKAGLSYAEMLTNGISVDNVDALMRSIVEFVQETGKNTNRVLRQQWSSILGIDVADLAAAVNLNTETLNKVSDADLKYSNMLAETNAQLGYVAKRMHISELLGNVYENFMDGVASNIAGNAVGYMTWMALDVVEQLTGGIAIPTISVMGSGVDLETTVVGLMKSTIAGISILAQGINALSTLTKGGSLSLGIWGNTNAVMERGSGFMGLQAGVAQSTSVSSYVSNSNGDEMSDYAITSAKEDGEEQIKGAEEDENSTSALLKKLIKLLQGDDQDGNHVKVWVDNTDDIKVTLDGEDVRISGLNPYSVGG